jgi:hypothetical protein
VDKKGNRFCPQTRTAILCLRRPQNGNFEDKIARKGVAVVGWFKVVAIPSWSHQGSTSVVVCGIPLLSRSCTAARWFIWRGTTGVCRMCALQGFPVFPRGLGSSLLGFQVREWAICQTPLPREGGRQRVLSNPHFGGVLGSARGTRNGDFCQP